MARGEGGSSHSGGGNTNSNSSRHRVTNSGRGNGNSSNSLDGNFNSRGLNINVNLIMFLIDVACDTLLPNSRYKRKIRRLLKLSIVPMILTIAGTVASISTSSPWLLYFIIPIFLVGLILGIVGFITAKCNDDVISVNEDISNLEIGDATLNNHNKDIPSQEDEGAIYIGGRRVN